MTEFAEVYRAYADLVRRVLGRLLPASEVDDGVQEVFLKIHRHLDRFRGEASLKSWVYRISFNTAQDFHRNQTWLRSLRALRAGASFKDAVDARPNAEKACSDRQLISLCMERLSFKERSILILFYWEDQKVEEIAQHLSVPVGTVKSRLNTARNRLETLLRKEGETL